MIIRKKFINDSDPLTIFKNMTNDPRLTDKARGLYMRLFVAADGAELPDEFIDMGRTGGTVAVMKAFRELERHGYAHVESECHPNKADIYSRVVNHCFLKGGAGQ